MLRALVEAERGLEAALPGRHMPWPRIAGLYATCLLQLGRLAEAKEYGDCTILAAARAALDKYLIDVTQPIALVEAALGNFDAAVAYADGEIRRFTARRE